MGGNPLAGNLGRSEYGRLKGETGRRGSKVPPHNPNSKEDPDSPGCTLGPIVCGPPRAQGPSAVASREPSGRQTPPDRTRAGPPHATKWYDMGNNPYSRVDQGLFDGMKPPRCLPRNSDQKVPLGIAKLERREGRLVGPRREAEAGVRVHGRRVARSPRMGQKTQDPGEARATQAGWRSLSSGRQRPICIGPETLTHAPIALIAICQTILNLPRFRRKVRPRGFHAPLTIQHAEFAGRALEKPHSLKGPWTPDPCHPAQTLLAETHLQTWGRGSGLRGARIRRLDRHGISYLGHPSAGSSMASSGYWGRGNCRARFGARETGWIS